jgi:hypothetical protein
MRERLPDVTVDDLRKHIDTIEESYEFFIAYAAQGLSGDGSSTSGGELREYLKRTDQALGALMDEMGGVVDGLEPADAYGDMGKVIERDAGDTRSAVRLVMAQPGISSQLIDNLNASIHFRALLTDLFLFDEVLKSSAR